MTKPSKDSSMMETTIWKRFPHRIKGLLKREKCHPISPPLSSNYTKTKPSLIYRIFPSNKNKKPKFSKESPFIQLKNSQWGNNPDFHVSGIDIATEVPLRANIMSFFTSNAQQQQQQQQGWPGMLNKNENLDNVSRVYIGTLSKMRLLSHYTMEQQLAIHHLLSRIQNKTQQQQQQQQQLKKPRSGNVVFQHDFNSLLSGKVSDSIMMNNRKPRRTRYIFMLLSTPVSHVTNKVHPVTEALCKLRKPYAETISTITSQMILEQENALVILKQEKERRDAYKFVPADYLLDPTTLRGRGTNHSSELLQNRLGTKFSGSSTNHLQQQQQQQQQNNVFISNNNDSSTIAPFMAKIQIQTS
ncbi:hypothetical protein HPULCUR_011540 [Helicostylum pulchrum]|uniref:Uncharacterized protein n=1 Tax=Helicostylum pulchrum TaxID=562976 RepID=A0ABP9YGD2_9FUNG